MIQRREIISTEDESDAICMNIIQKQ